ncbi:MAG: type II secretion system F family protein [Chloroflexi bacterium]|nr:type II secretion system F family protein [Chloroflexota bacterium]
MRYRYIGYNSSEGISRGEVTANSMAEAALAIREQGYRPLSLQRQHRLPALDELFPSLFRVSPGDLVNLTRQLATLVGTGTSLVRALDLMQRQTKNRVMRRSLAAILQSLDRGDSLSRAISQHPKVFGKLFCRVVEVGEHAGKLDTSLRQIANLLERERQARKKAMKALMYPLAVVGMALVVTAVLFTVALPRLLDAFNQMGSSVPLATRLALLLADQVSSNLSFIMVGLVALVVLGKLLLRLRRVRYCWDTVRLRVPVLGPLLVANELARFCRAASILLPAGVAIPVVMDLTVESSNNLVLRRAFSDAKESVMRGKSLATGLGRHRVIPPMLLQMVTTGEETNSISQAMSDVADAYEQQTDDKLNALVSIIEPAATLGVALLIGFIAFSMFVPIYSGLNSLQ